MLYDSKHHDMIKLRQMITFYLPSMYFRNHKLNVSSFQPHYPNYWTFVWGDNQCQWAWGCFTNISRALQSILSKFVYCGNSTWYANFKLKLCTCAQSHALGTRTKFQLEILTINVILGIVYFREIILESNAEDEAYSVHEINLFPPSAAYMRQWLGPALVQAMACRLFGTKPFPEPMLTCCQLDR